MIIAQFDLALREATPPGEVEPDQIAVSGETFDVVHEVSNMPLMRFAYAYYSDNTTETEALAASYALLRHCIAAKDWDRFETHLSRYRVRGGEVAKLASAIYGHITGRPTPPPSASSDGRLSTSQTSKPDSPSPEPAQPSRPDLQVPMVALDDLVSD